MESELFVEAYESVLRVKMPSTKAADVVRAVLQVDDELQPSRIKKTIDIEDSHLVVYR